MNEFRKELEISIDKYGVHCTHVMLDSNKNIMYGVFADSRNSFVVTRDFKLDSDKGIELADELDISHTEL